MSKRGHKSRDRQSTHPYLSGNFAPVSRALPLTRCTIAGTIPHDLIGGQYVRNGANPLQSNDIERDLHWFDGDGMLTGVLFRSDHQSDQKIVPEFVNQPVLTDVYLSGSTSRIQRPVVPSIRTLIDPLSSILCIMYHIVRAILLVLMSHLPGSSFAIRRISVANTSLFWHDGRALASCDSGPPMRIALPTLETVGWFDGSQVEGEIPISSEDDQTTFSGNGPLGFMKEWTTAHPRIDPITQELILFHSMIKAPYIHVSVIPSTYTNTQHHLPRIIAEPLPGVSSSKLMHDFGVSSQHTVILDLPLSLSPSNLLYNKPVVDYNQTGISRYGVFPRHKPQEVRWFESPAPCCIFHTANSWDEVSVEMSQITVRAVNMIACRLINADMIYAAGDLPSPPRLSHDADEAQCRLYYYQFDLASPQNRNIISHQWALSTIPFEFPTIRHSASMTEAQFAYGCSISTSNFGAALGSSVKIDCLVKINTMELVKRGRANPPCSITGSVDTRSISEILSSADSQDPIKVFKTPENWFAQEPRFVPKLHGISEDDGYVLSYLFDEGQLDTLGRVPSSANSELWIIDAKEMNTVIARVHLPQRVPYGLHGDWFDEHMISNQRPVETLRKLPLVAGAERSTFTWKLWMSLRGWIEELI
ncbi:MAG: hypothetical protein M1814_000629 [Vezdaea aestivalis]|nr:MAG: hypothetical protein M1814_000629 [Vezdaea aestivalis]